MSLNGKKVAFLVANEGIEQAELTEPWNAVSSGQGQPVLIAPKPGQAQAFNHLDKADAFDVDLTTDQAKVADYDALVLPGGVANPDQLRLDGPAVAFVQEFVASGKPVAAICHAPWILIEAGVVAGRRVTSWPSVRTDLTNAGATWLDEDAVIDSTGPGPLITSRKPDDLPAFTKALSDNV
jgi:protease I